MEYPKDYRTVAKRMASIKEDVRDSGYMASGKRIMENEFKATIDYFRESNLLTLFAAKAIYKEKDYEFGVYCVGVVDFTTGGCHTTSFGISKKEYETGKFSDMIYDNLARDAVRQKAMRESPEWKNHWFNNLSRS
jgi:hypothetical protein